MKIAPFIHEITGYNQSSKEETEHILVHTGQHYDDRMSKAFFKALNIPDADINLDIGSGTHAEQVGNTMIAFEKVLLKEKPDWIIVLGDVNATLACSVTAKKLHIKVCHIEAGLRLSDERMPEEINRLVADRLSDLLLTPDTLSIENLRKEGIPDSKIKFVGNIMIDTLESNRKKAFNLSIDKIVNENIINNQNTLKLNSYALMTLHRPSNVDTKKILAPIIDFIIDKVTKEMSLVWALHPRTKKQLEKFGLMNKVASCKNLILLHPLGYHEMLRLNMNANLMLTDSGGLQEECTILGTPCLTLRWNTERPITLKKYGGVSILVGNNIENIQNAYNEIKNKAKQPERPELWDGKTAERCLKAIIDYIDTDKSSSAALA